MSFDLNNHTQTELQGHAINLGPVDPTATRTVVQDASGVATLVNLDGTSREPLDSDLSWGQFFTDGVEFIYATNGRLLRRICTDGKPLTIQSSGVGGILWLSPDNSVMAYFTSQDPNSGNTDVLLASTLTQSSPVTINADGSAQFTGYTLDSHNALFYNAVDSTGTFGTFTAMPTTGGRGHSYGVGGSKVYGDYQLPGGTGGKTIFNDHYVAATTTRPEHASFNIVDVNGTAAPTLLAANADLAFGVTWDNSTFVYTTSAIR